MPCRDGRDNFRCEHEYEEHLSERERENRFSECQRKLDETTALLCSFLQCFLTDRKVPEKVRLWGVTHCLHDKKDNRPWDVMVSSKLYHIAGNSDFIKYEDDNQEDRKMSDFVSACKSAERFVRRPCFFYSFGRDGIKHYYAYDIDDFSVVAVNIDEPSYMRIPMEICNSFGLSLSSKDVIENDWESI